MTGLAALARLPFAERRAEIRQIGAQALRTDWRLWARDGQRPPPGDWRTWLLMAGRGFGKTRAGAEWVRSIAESDGRARIALVAATISEARAVMIEGESGLLAVAPAATRPRWEPTRGRLSWRSGAQAFVFSGENPDGLRGAQHSHAWCDELAKWAYADETWSNLQLGLRAGVRPRALVTTTPRPVAVLRGLLSDPTVAVTRGATRDNRWLAEGFVAAVEAMYGGTRLGRQELDGELIEEVAGALWTRAIIEACRVRVAPELRRVVVGVDPPAGSVLGQAQGGRSGGGDACGIVVVGLGRDGLGYVIEDASVGPLAPDAWARAVAEAAGRHRADRVVAEANNGGAMVESVLRAADARLPVKLVHASRGKAARAEPVAALYGSGRAFHVGAWPELEDELCGLVAGGGYAGPGRSPDRADACVWALTELMLGARGAWPRVWVV